MKAQFLIITLTLTSMIAACGGSGGGDSGTGSILDGTSLPPNILNKRIKTQSIDAYNDGVADQITTFTYDESGRVSSRRVQEFGDFGDDDYTVTYSHDDNGNLLSKVSSTGTSDTHTYVNGQLVSSNRHWDGDFTFSYDVNGKLTEMTGDYFYDDCDSDDVVSSTDTETSTDVESSVITYSGNQIASIKSADGINSELYTYGSNGQLQKIEEIENCNPDDTDSVPFQDTTVFSYNTDGALSGYQLNGDFYTLDVNGLPLAINGSLPESADYVYDENGRLQSITRDAGSTSTITLNYSQDGLVQSQEYVSDSTNRFFVIPDQTVTMTYEDGDCIVGLSSDPITRLLSAYLGELPVNPYMHCGYHLDGSF